MTRRCSMRSSRTRAFCRRGLICLSWVGLAAAAAAAERYKPTDPHTVVLQLGPLVATAGSTEQQVGLLLARARTDRDPRYAGRAEALLAARLRSPDPPVALLIAQADLLQQRHAFPAALETLDRVIGRVPGDAGARLMRAQLRIVTGEFAEARSDCTAVIAAGDTAAGSVCLAQVEAVTGSPRATQLCALVLAWARHLAPEVAAWGHAVCAELAQRGGDTAGAEKALRAGLAISPRDEFMRVALVDLLLARGAAREALPLLELERPSAAMLLRRVLALNASGMHPGQALAELRELIALAVRRGERVHLREEALLALEVEQDYPKALALAQQNFALQKELADVRLLARAAKAARSTSAERELRRWVEALGYSDVVVRELLT